MKKEVILVIIFVILISNLSAEYELGNKSYSIENEYAPESSIRGWINVSFAGEPLSSLFTDNFDNNVTLNSILKNQAYQTTCHTKECADDYIFFNETEEKNFILNKGVKATFGLVLYENIKDIIKAEINFSSNASSSCENQLKINFLFEEDDEEYEFGNTNWLIQECESSEKNHSCFNDGAAKTVAIVDRYSYCQKFRLPEAPAFKVGAQLERVSSQPSRLFIQLWGYETNQYLTDCEIFMSNGESGEFSCDLEYLVAQEKDYYLCLYANNDTTVYRTYRNVDIIDGCGFYGTPSAGKDLDAAYEIFFQPKKFDSLGTIGLVSASNLSLVNFTTFLENIIEYRYGDMKCKGGCVIPFQMLSNQNSQYTVINNVYIEYRTDQGPSIQENIYEIEESKARVNSKFQKLYLDYGGFSVPEKKDVYLYKLFFNNEKILEKNITVGNVPIINSIAPLKAPLGYDTEFTASITKSQANISRYIWDFDGSKKTTTQNKVTHTFNSAGIHNLTLTVADLNNKNSSKTVQINVNTPQIQIEQDIAKLRKSIENIRNKIKSYPAFQKDTIENLLNLSGKSNDLADIDTEYKLAVNDSEFLVILAKLDKISLPDSISETDSANSLIFFPDESNIKLDSVANVSASDYDFEKTSKYKKAIISWNQQNIQTKISYKEISGLKDSVQNHVITFIDVSTERIGSDSSSAYLFIDKIDDLSFKANYNEIELDDSYVIALGDTTDIISFSTTEQIEFTDLGVFISPTFSSLDLPNTVICRMDDECDDGQYCEDGVCVDEPMSKWVFFGLAIIFLLILTFIVYIILFNWYKNKYETHLFKNRNNLFNLLNYINHQKKKGTSDSTIISRLKKSKWKSEQITYAMKKYHGQNTGMFALPFVKMIFGKKNRKMKLPPKRPGFGMRPGMPPRRFNPRGKK